MLDVVVLHKKAATTNASNVKSKDIITKAHGICLDTCPTCPPGEEASTMKQNIQWMKEVHTAPREKITRP